MLMSGLIIGMNGWGKWVFITYVKGTFFGMSENIYCSIFTA
jgi:hypothetical protein